MLNFLNSPSLCVNIIITLILIFCFIPISCATYHYDTGFFYDYPDQKQTEQFLIYLKQAYPQLAELHTLGFSTEGRAIQALHLSSNTYPHEHKPALLFTALIHSDEWISLPVVLYLAHQFASTYEYDREIRDIVDHTHLWFVPIVNPDGYAYSRSSDRNWRKNRTPFADSAIGADINRNFDVMWNIKGGFSKDPSSRFYRGPSSASEPETRALQELATRIRFQAAVDFHSFGQFILYPYGYSRTPCPDEKLYKQLASGMVQVIYSNNGSKYNALQMCRIYPHGLASGNLMDYLYTRYSTMSFTIELPPRMKEQGGVSPAPECILTAGKEAFAAIKYLCEWIRQAGD